MRENVYLKYTEIAEAERKTNNPIPPEILVHLVAAEFVANTIREVFTDPPKDPRQLLVG